ncbi:MAG: recombinase family protein, partial [Leifsonia sp.]
AIVLPASGVDTTAAAGPAAKFSAQIQAAAAELERGLISARTREGMAQRKADGWAPTDRNVLGRPPGNPQRIPDDVRARIAKERASGTPFAKIADRLNADGIATAHGGRRWYPATVKAAIEARG